MPSRILISSLIAAGSMGLLGCQSNGADTPTSSESTENTPLDTSSDVSDREVEMGNLAGRLLQASSDAPAILIVPGSGPTDRDGNNAMGVSAAPYRRLADDLAQSGLTTLRVDKRGMFSSAAAGDPNQVSLDIYAQDYLDWAETLRTETGQDCVFLLGHSEGGQMVSAAAAQDNSGICGLILIAAPGRPLFDVLREQLMANPANAPLLDQALGAIDELEAGNRVETENLHPALAPLFAPQVQDFMISSYGVDPQTLVAQAAVPTLVLQGDRDIQISVADAERLSEPANASLVILPEVNHVLKLSPESRAGNLATYSNSDLPLADSVAPAISNFITEVQATKP